MTSTRDLSGVPGWSVSRISWADVVGRPSPTHPLTAAVEAASAELMSVLDAPVWSLDARQTADLISRLEQLSSQVASAKLRVLTHAGGIGIEKESGAATTATWLARHTRQTRRAAAHDVRLAAALDTCEIAADALAAGSICLEAAEVISAAVTALPTDTVPTDVRRAAETKLVDLAAHHDPVELKILGRRILDIVAPEIGQAEEARQLATEERHARARTRLSLRDRGDGTTDGRFTIPTAHADMLRTHLMALTSPARPQPETGESSETGDQAIERARQTLPDRLGAALLEYISRYPAAATPTAGGVAATIVVAIPLADLTAAVESAGVAEILGGNGAGTRITAATARRWACEAGLVPAVLDGTSQPLDLGREQRLHTRAQRTAMALRDGGCTTQHCGWPPSMCHAHHDRPWAEGGHTTLDNGRLLCPHHHTLIHDPDYQVEHLQPGIPGGKIRFHRRT